MDGFIVLPRGRSSSLLSEDGEGGRDISSMVTMAVCWSRSTCARTDQ